MFGKKKEQALNQELDLLKHEIAELRGIIKTQELVKLRAENEQLREKSALIDKVRFSLKDVYYDSETGSLLVKYNFPNIRVYFNEDGTVQKNPLFIAINKLRLIPLEDMKKIQNCIDQVKNTKERS